MLHCPVIDGFTSEIDRNGNIRNMLRAIVPPSLIGLSFFDGQINNQRNIRDDLRVQVKKM